MNRALSTLDVAGRQRAVDFALNFTHNTHLEPRAYERMLLEQFVRGELTLDQVEARLECAPDSLIGAVGK